MEKITAKNIEEAAYQLLANTGTKYPKNYLEKLVDHFKKETNSGAKSVLVSILQNIVYAGVFKGKRLDDIFPDGHCLGGPDGGFCQGFFDITLDGHTGG